jgi:pyridoxine 5-phosphate synthase
VSVRLSVNVNKVATVRNSRGGSIPDPVAAARVCVEAGCPGLTVHPRADQRHIRPDDVRAIAEYLAPLRGRVEFNIEGDPRPELIALVHEVRPDQCTLVPVRPGEITSQAGWPADTPKGELSALVEDLKGRDVRVSLFVDAEPAPIRWAADLGADRVELYTEPYARAFEAGEPAARASFARYSAAARLAHEHGLGINAGHDLDLANLVLFRTLPHLDEVSIGHAVISRALFVGLDRVIREYLSVLA